MRIPFLFFAIAMLFIMGCNGDWMDYSPADMYSASIDYDDADAPLRLDVAAVTIASDKDNKSAVLADMQSMTEQIMLEHPEVDVIEFGELILGWYYDSDSEEAYQRAVSEPIPGSSFYVLQELAISHQINLVYGAAEVDTVTNKIYNSQVLIKKTGDYVVYRKRNLNDLDIANGFSAGSEFVSTTIDGVNVAMFICSDMQSNQITEEMADADVDVILQSVTSTTDMSADISYVGMQMNKWIVFANRFGTEGDFNYTGFSHIINPAGTFTDRVMGENVYVFRSLGIY